MQESTAPSLSNQTKGDKELQKAGCESGESSHQRAVQRDYNKGESTGTKKETRLETTTPLQSTSESQRPHNGHNTLNTTTCSNDNNNTTTSSTCMSTQTNSFRDMQQQQSLNIGILMSYPALNLHPGGAIPYPTNPCSKFTYTLDGICNNSMEMSPINQQSVFPWISHHVQYPSQNLQQQQLYPTYPMQYNSGNPYNKKNLNFVATKILHDWYAANIHNPYPSNDEVRQLATRGCVTEAQVRKWLANRRLRTGNTYRYNNLKRGGGRKRRKMAVGDSIKPSFDNLIMNSKVFGMKKESFPLAASSGDVKSEWMYDDKVYGSEIHQHIKQENNSSRSDYC